LPTTLCKFVPICNYTPEVTELPWINLTAIVIPYIGLSKESKVITFIAVEAIVLQVPYKVVPIATSWEPTYTFPIYVLMVHPLLSIHQLIQKYSVCVIMGQHHLLILIHDYLHLLLPRNQGSNKILF
jgi:hypothetical protein